jgi:hypothetical protein
MSEKEVELINKTAEKIVDSGWELGALFILNALKPVYFIGGELGHFFLAPYLILLEGKGDQFLDTFEKRENIQKLILKIEEFSEQKHQDKIEERKIKDEKVINVYDLIKKTIQKISGKKV